MANEPGGIEPSVGGGTGADDGELRELQALCLDFAARAARFIRDERPSRELGSRTKSSDTDVVTEMDEASERMLRELISAARPEDGVLGEEGDDTPGTSGLTWVLDPIDGTVNYVYDLPAYSVSVAVVRGDARTEGAWEPLAGAVADPSLREVHHARLGGGAFTCTEDEALAAGGSPQRLAESTPLRVGEETQLAQCLLATGFSYSPAIRRAQGELMVTALEHVRDIRRGGSAALDLVRVAQGRVDAYAEAMLNPWDIAAGVLLVTEAGGRVGGRDGHAGRDLLVAAGPGLFDAVHGLFTTGPPVTAAEG